MNDSPDLIQNCANILKRNYSTQPETADFCFIL